VAIDTDSAYGLFEIEGTLFGLSRRQLWRLDSGGLVPPDDEPYREFDEILVTGNRVLLYDENERGLWTTDRTAERTVLLQFLARPDPD
jgi:hypothetical protein